MPLENLKALCADAEHEKARLTAARDDLNARAVQLSMEIASAELRWSEYRNALQVRTLNAGRPDDQQVISIAEADS